MTFAFAFLAGWLDVAGAAAQAVPPCSLLTQAQVDAALGLIAKLQ